MAKRILIAEDSPTILEIMKDVVESAGFDVIPAVDGKEALDKSRNEKPDLIVLDIMLPHIDGYKVCAMLKFDNTYKNIPIIIMTARAGDDDKQQGKEVKADTYLTKPLDPELLVSKIKELLEK